MLATIVASLLVTASATAPATTPGPFLSLEAPVDRPAAVDEGFGRLVGHWRCESESRQPDGSWQAGPGGGADWSFYYALDGRAIQDIWRPTQGAVGTNLRTWDEEAGHWRMVWATANQARFDHFDATVDDEGRIIMTGERRARATFQQHQARITFHEIGKESFAWRYEASSTGEEGSFNEMVRIGCRRKPGAS